MNKSSFYLLHWTCLKLIFKLNWVKLLWTNLQWIFQRVHENKMLWSSSAQPWTRILSWLANHQNGQVSVIISCSSVWSILLTNECTATTFKEGNRPKIRFSLIHPSLFPPLFALSVLTPCKFSLVSAKNGKVILLKSC